MPIAYRISQTDFGYTGQRSLGGDLGLMDYRARFYDPYLSRFIQPDTVIPNPSNPQAFNRFSYVLNRPMIFTDPTGHDPWWCEGRDNEAECIAGWMEAQVGRTGGGGNGGDIDSDTNGGGDGGVIVEDHVTYELGDFQLLPATYDPSTYSQIAEEGYSGYWLSGAPAYGDVLFPPFSVNSRQVGWGAFGAFPSILVDWANIAAPYAQRAVSPHDQNVSLIYSVSYYNVPRKDAYSVTTVHELLITNSSSSKRVLNYTVAISSPSLRNVIRSGVLSAVPNETIHVTMPAEFSFTDVLNVAVHAFTGCTGPCITSNPPPAALAGFGNFSFSP